MLFLFPLIFLLFAHCSRNVKLKCQFCQICLITKHGQPVVLKLIPVIWVFVVHKLLLGIIEDGAREVLLLFPLLGFKLPEQPSHSRNPRIKLRLLVEGVAAGRGVAVDGEHEGGRVEVLQPKAWPELGGEDNREEEQLKITSCHPHCAQLFPLQVQLISLSFLTFITKAKVPDQRTLTTTYQSSLDQSQLWAAGWVVKAGTHGASLRPDVTMWKWIWYIFEPSCLAAPPLETCDGGTDGSAGSRLSLWKGYGVIHPVNLLQHFNNCETQPPASIALHWLSSSPSLVRPASVTSPLISTIWCFGPYKPYIFCEDMILAIYQCHHIPIWRSSYIHMLYFQKGALVCYFGHMMNHHDHHIIRWWTSYHPTSVKKKSIKNWPKYGVFRQKTPFPATDFPFPLTFRENLVRGGPGGVPPYRKVSVTGVIERFPIS